MALTDRAHPALLVLLGFVLLVVLAVVAFTVYRSGKPDDGYTGGPETMTVPAPAQQP